MHYERCSRDADNQPYSHETQCTLATPDDAAPGKEKRALAEGEMPQIFARVMGDYYFLTRVEDLSTIIEIADYALELA